MKTARRRKAPPKVNPDAVEFLAEKARKGWKEGEAVIGALADALVEATSPRDFERVAVELGWTECCQGTGYREVRFGDAGAEVPCTECGVG